MSQGINNDVAATSSRRIFKKITLVDAGTLSVWRDGELHHP